MTRQRHDFIWQSARYDIGVTVNGLTVDLPRFPHVQSVHFCMCRGTPLAIHLVMSDQTISYIHYGKDDVELEVIARISGATDDLGSMCELDIESVEDQDGTPVDQDTIGQYGVTWTELESSAWENAEIALSEPEVSYDD